MLIPLVVDILRLVGNISTQINNKVHKNLIHFTWIIENINYFLVKNLVSEKDP